MTSTFIAKPTFSPLGRTKYGDIFFTFKRSITAAIYREQGAACPFSTHLTMAYPNVFTDCFDTDTSCPTQATSFSFTSCDIRLLR